MKTKKLIAFVAVLMLAIVSCRKEPIKAPEQPQAAFNLQDAIKAINSQYCTTNSTHAPNPWKTMGADLGGAWAVGEAGSIFGPWGAFIGGVIGGVGASVSYACGINQGPSGAVGVFEVNPNNPYDQVGIAHNAICADIMANLGLYYRKGVMNYQAIYNRAVSLAVNFYNTHNSAAKSISDNPITFDQFMQGVSISTAPILTRETAVQNIITSYLTNVANVTGGKQGIVDFTIAYENLIAKTTISAAGKIGLYCGLATARNSYMFWN